LTNDREEFQVRFTCHVNFQMFALITYTYRMYNTFLERVDNSQIYIVPTYTGIVWNWQSYLENVWKLVY